MFGNAYTTTVAARTYPDGRSDKCQPVAGTCVFVAAHFWAPAPPEAKHTVSKVDFYREKRITGVSARFGLLSQEHNAMANPRPAQQKQRAFGSKRTWCASQLLKDCVFGEGDISQKGFVMEERQAQI